MRILLLAIILTTLSACADYYRLEDFGYDFTDTTPMGIKYRVDGFATPLDPAQLDYYFTSTMDCVAINFDPEKLLVISTPEDANPTANQRIEGFAWRDTPNRIAMIVMNTTGAPHDQYRLFTHELIHILLRRDNHRDEAFGRCGWQSY